VIGPGTVINPIIKIVTVVAVLAATYFFIVKPVLDTTESAIDRSFDAVDDSFAGFDSLPNQIQGDIDEALESSNNSQRLQSCIERALDRGGSPNTRRINRCVERFSP
jgi:hypothetical protein